jgi:hypothetical protein
MEQERTEIRQYIMPEILKKYNPEDPPEEEIFEYVPSFFKQTKRRTRITDEQKAVRMLQYRQKLLRKNTDSKIQS